MLLEKNLAQFFYKNHIIWFNNNKMLKTNLLKYYLIITDGLNLLKKKKVK
jgi:hypothetical protein